MPDLRVDAGQVQRIHRRLRPVSVPNAKISRARFLVARHAGHPADCAMVYALGESLSLLEHCCCGQRRRIARRSIGLALRLPADLLTLPELVEREHRMSMHRSIGHYRNWGKSAQGA